MGEIERRSETIVVWNICTCGRPLSMIHEAKRGQCSMCWVKSMPPDTKAAMNELICAAFRTPKPDAEQASQLIDNAVNKLARDQKQQTSDEGFQQ